MVNPPIQTPEGVGDLPAWGRLCELIARGAGVCDHPERAGCETPASTSFLSVEADRVEHHRRNSIPFLIEHCGLAGRSVLEFGAGTGGLSVAMALAGVQTVAAVEPVERNEEAGRWRARAYGVEGAVQFHHLPDTRRLPFADETFDAVVCSSVLQYVPDAELRRVLLTEMGRVVRQGGVLAVCATGNGLYLAGPHSSRWWSNLMPARASRLGHNRGITYPELDRILSPQGFHLLPQGTASLERWYRRTNARRAAGRRRLITAASAMAFRVAGGLLGRLAGIPLEALLPYPDLAFRKSGRSDARGPDGAR